ncbi:DASH complex, subunit Dad2 [Metschnikowia bicuspidata var. bicuspidata NRRL YB-4993]|uniref:DASH complex subunit DAD2 n=1 Tax=Metschnikowia bicuspidata var. bicuspidata NRRL YB-4993 TaxID=869754 RepID=A0A1A0HKM5_9ASCO|nr:DASH complex, subunit Dad2 [Metschnikowia bicuspidata var. bicuspidata NRRL YB-4993]OBA24358.1 DASH complex, subunit Dad2 [Metschnikowia bicuspidata var. bicuspidata NRRL YB-4993]
MKNTLQQKIDEKARQLQELKEINRFTNILAQQLDEIEKKLEVMTDGSESVAYILSNWKNVASAISLASLGIANHASRVNDNNEPMPELLVRLNWSEDSDDIDT